MALDWGVGMDSAMALVLLHMDPSPRQWLLELFADI